MFATIRRHQKWLLLVIIVVVIISFVIFLDPTIMGGRGQLPMTKVHYGSLNGRELSLEEIRGAYAEARLRFRIMFGSWPEELEGRQSWFDPDRALAERLVILETLREQNIYLSEAAAADWIAAVFRDPDQNAFSLRRYQLFVDRILASARMTEGDLRRLARHEAGIQHLLSLAGLSGDLVTPREAESEFRRQHEQLRTAVALFSHSNYLAQVMIDEDALRRYYTNQAPNYRVPERVQVAYVSFPFTNYLAAAEQSLAARTNLSLELDQIYLERGPNAFRGPDGKVLNREAARERLRSERLDALAQIEAQKSAALFAQELYDLFQQEPANLDNLSRLAAAKGLESKVTEPFTMFSRPPELEVGEDFTRAAFALSTNQPMALDPIIGDDAVHVFTFQRRIPSEIPPLEEVRLRVTTEFRRREAIQAAERAGRESYSRLTNSVAQSKTFQEACAEAGLEPIEPPAFSLSTRSLPGLRPDLSLSLLKDVASSLSPGETSAFVSSGTGGMIVHLLAREPADQATVQAELPAFLEELREERHRQAFTAWLRHQIELTSLTGLPRLSDAE